MKDADYISHALEQSLADIEPVPFRERLHEVVDGVSLTPGVLTIVTARAMEPSVEETASAKRGAGVQLSYEGLRLTRAVLRERDWEVNEDKSYYRDLLAASVLVSRGFYYLADTGVADQSVEIVRRFGRNETYKQQSVTGELEDSLEVDVIRLAVNAGADMAVQTIPPAVTSYADTIARELESEPLPAPEEALGGVEERIGTLAGTPDPTGVDEYDE